MDPAIDTILTGARARSALHEPELTPEEVVGLENLGLTEYLGTGNGADAGAATGRHRQNVHHGQFESR